MLLSQQCSSSLSDVFFFGHLLFCFFVEPNAPVPSRLTSQRRGRPSFSNGDHYSSETAGGPPIGRRTHSARTTPSDYVCRRRCSPEHAPRLGFLVARSRPVASRQLRSGQAQTKPTRLVRSTLSQHVVPCQPRAAQLPAHLRERSVQAPRLPVDLSFVSCLGGSRTSEHTKDKRTAINAFETPLAEG